MRQIHVLRRVMIAGVLLGITLFGSLALLGRGGRAAGAADVGWPAFRGTSGTGASSETGWLTQWPAEGPKLLWQADVARDFGGLAISHGRVYLLGTTKELTKAGTLKDISKAYCLDADTGKERWSSDIGAMPASSMGTGSTPTVAETRVVCMGSDSSVNCLDVETGRIIWTQPLGLGAGQYCYASSPLVHDGKVIVLAGSSIQAFNLEDGKLVWKTAWAIPPDGGRWSSPVFATFDGVPTVVCLSRCNLVGLNPDDGTVRWLFPLEAKPTGEDLPNTPAISGNRIVFLGWRALAARKTKIVCVEIKDGKAQQDWITANPIGNRTQSLTIWDQCVYLTSNVIPEVGPDDVKGQVNCFDLGTGNKLWYSTAPQAHSHIPATPKPLISNDGGTFLIAGGSLLLLDGTGHLTVSDVSAKGCTVISDANVSSVMNAPKALGDMQYVSPPLLLNGRIYLRNHNKVACYDVSGAPAGP